MLRSQSDVSLLFFSLYLFYVASFFIACVGGRTDTDAMSVCGITGTDFSVAGECRLEEGVHTRFRYGKGERESE